MNGPWFLLQSRAQLAQLSLSLTLSLSSSFSSSSSSSSLLLSLSEQHTALGCLLIQVISSPLCCIPLHSALSPVLLEEEQLIYLHYTGWLMLQRLRTAGPSYRSPQAALDPLLLVRLPAVSNHELSSRISTITHWERSSAAQASYQRKAWASALLCTSSEQLQSCFLSSPLPLLCSRLTLRGWSSLSASFFLFSLPFLILHATWLVLPLSASISLSLSLCLSLSFSHTS